MNYDISDFLLIAALCIILAGAVIIALVVELAPAGRLSNPRSWLLASTLGMGVIFFAAKILMITTITMLPHDTTEPHAGVVDKAQQTKQKPTEYRWVKLAQGDRTEQNFPLPTTSNYRWQTLPEQVPSPEHNPTTPEKIALGKQLFNDSQLSLDGSVSCASCHDLFQQAGSDGRTTSQGIHNQMGQRNAPTVWNAAFQERLFWDGRAASLEEQAKGPLINPIEMGMPSYEEVIKRVKAQAHYQQQFDLAFGKQTDITIDRVAQAIAAYERTLVTADSAYDRFVKGDRAALSDQQLRGMAYFESLGCVSCHSGPNFSEASIFGNTSPWRLFPAHPTPLEDEFSLFESMENEVPIRAAWRIPSLRNVALTGPWLHNGSVTDLKDMVRIMAATQLGWSGHYLLWADNTNTLKEVDQPMLNEQQINDVVAFLQALSSERLINAVKD